MGECGDNGMPPPIPFGLCGECSGMLSIDEAVYVGRCSGCIEDAELARKRPALYAMLGLIA